MEQMGEDVTVLQPHKGTSETAPTVPARRTISSFNPTRVRLKPANQGYAYGKFQLQPHKGTSETISPASPPPNASGLQPHKGTSETAIMEQMGEDVTVLQPHKGTSETISERLARATPIASTPQGYV